MKLDRWKSTINDGGLDQVFSDLYREPKEESRERYSKLLDLFCQSFPRTAEDGDIRIFSAPGRTEISGNHTDHQLGIVLAAAVDMDMIAAAAVNGSNVIRLMSEGYGMMEISLDDLEPNENEFNTTPALIRGIAAGFKNEGCPVGGFDAVVSSKVLPGSGISSSAAFEVLVGQIVNGLFFSSGADAVKVARIGQYAENVFFGKPSGLMDQMASSVGNIVSIDFADPTAPIIRKLNVDFEKSGLSLCIINCGADHADLTHEYSAIPGEMKKVAAFFGEKVLRTVDEDEFYSKLRVLREKVSDRDILRAIHFFDENRRAQLCAAALENDDINAFLRVVRESGISSWVLLQNVSPAGEVNRQDMALALALCNKVLSGRGASRVHGGGFAGTCQAFVPADMTDDFVRQMEAYLGEGSCHVLSIREKGGTQIIPG